MYKFVGVRSIVPSACLLLRAIWRCSCFLVVGAYFRVELRGMSVRRKMIAVDTRSPVVQFILKKRQWKLLF